MGSLARHPNTQKMCEKAWNSWVSFEENYVKALVQTFIFAIITKIYCVKTEKYDSSPQQ